MKKSWHKIIKIALHSENLGSLAIFLLAGGLGAQRS